MNRSRKRSIFQRQLRHKLLSRSPDHRYDFGALWEFFSSKMVKFAMLYGIYGMVCWYGRSGKEKNWLFSSLGLLCDQMECQSPHIHDTVWLIRICLQNHHAHFLPTADIAIHYSDGQTDRQTDSQPTNQPVRVCLSRIVATDWEKAMGYFHLQFYFHIDSI